MSVLLVEAFYGGSHKQLVDLLHQRVDDCVLYTLPAKKWHWRARTSALYFTQNIPESPTYRALFASSVLNLAELVALRPDLGRLRKVLYFHENQLVYPVRKSQERDFQYGYNQVLSCMVADVVLFNSLFNMDSFLSSISSFFKTMPDHRPRHLQHLLQPKCQVLHFPISFPDVTRFLPKHKIHRRPRSSTDHPEVPQVSGPLSTDDPKFPQVSGPLSTDDPELPQRSDPIQTDQPGVLQGSGSISTDHSGVLQGSGSISTDHSGVLQGSGSISTDHSGVLQGSGSISTDHSGVPQGSGSISTDHSGVLQGSGPGSIGPSEVPPEASSAMDEVDESGCDWLSAASTNPHSLIVPAYQEELQGILANQELQGSAKASVAAPNPALHIVWPHRWEHDKDPELFFRILCKLKERGLPFQVSVLGETFTDVPDVFNKARSELQAHVRHWGFLPSKDDYLKVLCSADVVVSTAKHEFFGVAMLEAVHCGCHPLCPRALVYPEFFPDEYLYSTPEQLYKKLQGFCRRPDVVRRHHVKVDTSVFSWEALGDGFRRVLDCGSMAKDEDEEDDDDSKL